MVSTFIGLFAKLTASDIFAHEMNFVPGYFLIGEFLVSLFFLTGFLLPILIIVVTVYIQNRAFLKSAHYYLDYANGSDRVTERILVSLITLGLARPNLTLSSSLSSFLFAGPALQFLLYKLSSERDPPPFFSQSGNKKAWTHTSILI